MRKTNDPKEELEPIDDETEDLGDDDGEEELDLDQYDPSTLWPALAQYTTEMLEDEEWIDPELLPVYSVVLANLAQIVAKLINEPEAFDEDEDVS